MAAMLARWTTALTLSLLAAGPGRTEAAGPVDAAIVLAVDVSGSMDLEELEVQRAGYIAALRHPDLMRIVGALPNRRIALAHFEWAGDVRAGSTVPWTIVDGPAALEGFAAAVEALPIATSRGTSISRAIHHGLDLVAAAEFDAERWVIDVSGDGPNNVGPPVLEARARATAAGVTVNGLPIVLRPSQGVDFLPQYYAECVVGGLGAFVMPARSPEELAPAIQRKLFRELIGAVDDPEAAAITRVSDHAPIDCLIGEKRRQRREGAF